MIQFRDREEAKIYFADHFDDEVNGELRRLMVIAKEPNIAEEVALYKHSINNIVQLYAAAIKTGDMKLIDKSAQFMQDKLRNYADMVKIQAQLDSMSKDKITLDQFKAIMGRVLDVVSIECTRRGQHELAESIEETISEELNMQLNPRGTTLRPDRDVTEMIESVPRIDAN